MDNYCLYLRKSRADLELEARGELETLARHRKVLLELAKSRNLTIGSVYEEIVSGETIQARPIVQQLIDEVEQGQWAGVLVMEVERLARGDTIDQGIVARAFKVGGAKIITPLKTYDPNNEFDEEYFEFGLFMSRREYKTINRRIQRGRIASANEGKFIGSTPPYGYDKIRIKNDKGYTLSPIPEEASVVKQIFDWYASGDGMSVIARKLDQMGIKPRYRNTWSRSSISDMLSNPVYIGKLRWAYRKEQSYVEDGKLCTRRTVNKDPIYVDGLHPAIIEKNIFEQAQIMRNRNTHRKTKKGLTLQNPLSGLVYCKLCGQMMTRLGPNKRNKYSTLKCSNRYCDNVSAPIFLVEEKIISILKITLDRYRLSLEKQKPVHSDSIELLQSSLFSLKTEMEKIETQITNTYDLLEQEVYTVDIFTKRNRELARRKKVTKEHILKLEKEIKQVKQTNSMAHKLIPHMVSILEAYNKAETAKEKNAILHRLLERVEYQKNEPNTRGNLLNDNFEVHIFPKFANLDN